MKYVSKYVSQIFYKLRTNLFLLFKLKFFVYLEIISLVSKAEVFRVFSRLAEEYEQVNEKKNLGYVRSRTRLRNRSTTIFNIRILPETESTNL